MTSSWSLCFWTTSQYKDGLSRVVISIVKIRRSWDGLIFMMVIPVLMRRHFCTEMAPGNIAYEEKIMLIFMSVNLTMVLWFSHMAGECVASQIRSQYWNFEWPGWENTIVLICRMKRKGRHVDEFGVNDCAWFPLLYMWTKSLAFWELAVQRVMTNFLSSICCAASDVKFFHVLVFQF